MMMHDELPGDDWGSDTSPRPGMRERERNTVDMAPQRFGGSSGWEVKRRTEAAAGMAKDKHIAPVSHMNHTVWL